MLTLNWRAHLVWRGNTYTLLYEERLRDAYSDFCMAVASLVPHDAVQSSENSPSVKPRAPPR